MQHLLECYKIPNSVLKKEEYFYVRVFQKALENAEATILSDFNHIFEPQGLTYVVILGESHAILHTWPEKELIYIDFFSCKQEPRFKEFSEVFHSYGFDRIKHQIIER